MARKCQVRLLGGFRVDLDGIQVPPESWRHRRGADLVKLLALAQGHQLHREQVMTALWPDLETEAAGANLRKALHFARHALGGAAAITGDHDLIRLWPEGELEVDRDRFEAAAREALKAGSGLEAAGQLYGGDLLPADRYAEWTEPRREQARFTYLELCRADARWERLIEVDRADEEAHRALMSKHLAAGNRQAAIRQFQRLREALRVDLGVGPDQETVSLFEQALEMAAPQPPTVAERAQAMIARGLVAWNQQDLEQAERIAEDARRFAVENHLSRELGESSALLGLVAFAQGRWLERFRAEFEDTLGLTPADSAFVLDAHLCLCETTLGGADCASVAALARELLPAARQAGSLHCEAEATLLIGETQLLAGDLEGAEPWLRAARQGFEEVGSLSGQVLARVYLSDVAVRLGRRQPAAEELRRTLALASGCELAPHLVVRVHAGLVAAAAGPDGALEALDEADAAVPPGSTCAPCSIGLRINGAIACAAAGELSRARRYLVEAEGLAGMWRGGPWQAAAWEARAAVRLAEGDRDQAAGLLREAAAVYAGCGRAVDQARCEDAAARAGNALGTAPV